MRGQGRDRRDAARQREGQKGEGEMFLHGCGSERGRFQQAPPPHGDASAGRGFSIDVKAATPPTRAKARRARARYFFIGLAP